MRYAVQASPFTDAINIGRVNRKGDAFIDKEEATDMVLAAVGQYVIANFKGGMSATFPSMGFAVEVKVSPLVPPPLLAIPERDGDTIQPVETSITNPEEQP